MKSIFICMLLHATLCCMTVRAQSVLFQTMPAEKTDIHLRFLKPSFEPNDDQTFFSGVFDLQLNQALNPTWNLVLSLPYSTFTSGDGSNVKGIGNLYIGAQVKNTSMPDRLTVASIGLFLPTVGEDRSELEANVLGWYTNWHEIQRFFPRTLTIYGNVASNFHTANNIFYGFEIGPRFWIPTGEGADERDMEFFIHYGITGGVTVSDILIDAEVVGLIFLSGEAESFSDKMFHTLAFNAAYTGWSLQPGLFYTMYLKEEFSDIVSGVPGIGLTYKFE